MNPSPSCKLCGCWLLLIDFFRCIPASFLLSRSYAFSCPLVGNRAGGMCCILQVVFYICEDLNFTMWGTAGRMLVSQ